MIQRLSPEARSDLSLETLEDSIDLLDPDGQVEVVLLTWQEIRAHEQPRVDEILVYQVRGAERAALVTARTTSNTRTGVTLLGGLRLEPAPRDLRARFGFTTTPVSGFHYAFLALLLAIVASMAATAWGALRGPGALQTRVVWAVVALIGVGQLDLTWAGTSREQLLATIRLFAWQPFGVAAFKDPLFAPWTLRASLPLGALAYWTWRVARRTSQS